MSTGVKEKLMTIGSESSETDEEKRANGIRKVYLLMSLVKTCLGIFLIYKHRSIIATTKNETEKVLFEYIILYSFIWPISLLISASFFISVHVINMILQIIKPRTAWKREDRERDENDNTKFSNASFFYSSLLTFLVVLYFLSLPSGIVIVKKLGSQESMKKSYYIVMINCFIYLNLLTGVYVMIVTFYLTCFLRINQKKIEIDDEFVEAFEKNQLREKPKIARDGISSLSIATSNIHLNKQSNNNIRNNVSKNSSLHLDLGLINNNTSTDIEKIEKLKEFYGNGLFEEKNEGNLHSNEAENDNEKEYENYRINKSLSPKRSRNQIIEEMKNYYSPKIIRKSYETKNQQPSEFELDLITEHELKPRKLTTKNELTSVSPFKEKHDSQHLKVEVNTGNVLKEVEIKASRTPRKHRKTIII